MLRLRTKNLNTRIKSAQSEDLQVLRIAAIVGMAMFSGGAAPVCAANTIPVSVPEGTTEESIEINSDRQNIKSAVNVKGVAKNVSANVTNGTLSILGSDEYNYSAILTEAGGVINNLSASFDSTKVTINGGKSVSGAFVKSIGEITNITANIKNNTITGDGVLTGGFVSVESIGALSNLSGTGFVNNSVSTSADITGGVLYNQGSFGSIKNTTFTSNNVSTSSGVLNGGVYANIGTMSGNIENVTFTDNTATASNSSVKGGAIYNTGIFEGKIINSTFTGNKAIAQHGTALGGAIYTTTDLFIGADAGGTTLFRDNKVSDSTGEKNQAIYVDSRIAKLTLDARNNGKILIYDDIDGFEGYSLTINGDSTGKIGLYGALANANVTVNGGNVDLVNSVTTDFNFGQFTSNANAKYSIDLNVSTGKSDTFSVDTGSNGVITIDSLNVLGSLPDESKLIKILNSNSSNNVSISLTDNAIHKFNRDDIKKVQWNDEVPTNMSWGDTLLKYERDDIVHRTISAAASVYGGLNDSLQYNVTITEGSAKSSIMGDTLRLMNQANSTDARTFAANPSRNLHTVTEDLGSTGTGTFNIVGVVDSQYHDITSKIDTNGHTMFRVDKASTLNLSDILISNAKNEAGSVLNITNSGAVVNLSNVSIDATNGSNAIVNAGTINMSFPVERSINTSITGTGTLNINSPGKIRLEEGNSITQSVINLTQGQLAMYGLDDKLNAQINIGQSGHLNVYSSNIGGNIVNDGRFDAWRGTLNYEVSGNGITGIYETVIANKRIGNRMNLAENSVLTISADNVGGTITHNGALVGRSTLHLWGGTLSHAISGLYGYTIIEGDVIANALIQSAKTINDGNTLTINASNMGQYSSTISDTNNGTLVLTGGTLARSVTGSGTVHIKGNVAFKDATSTENITVRQSVIIDEGGNLTTSAGHFTAGTVTNNSILTLNGGILTQEILGSGTTNITGAVNSGVKIATTTNIVSGGNLTINASNIGGGISNDGILSLTGGTLDYEINGKGYINFVSGTTIITKAVNQYMTSSTGASIRISADNVGGNISFGHSGITLDSGRLTHNVSAVTIVVDTGQEVTIDKSASGSFNYRSQIRGTLRVENASNIYIASNANLSGNLYLGSGTFNSGVGGGGIIHIVGNVNRTTNSLGNRIYPRIVVEPTGVFTAPINYLFGAFTNNGVFNMSGTLSNKTIGGTGVTNINDSVMFNPGAKIDGELNFNNGTLNAQNVNNLNVHVNTFNDYTIGKATGSGIFKFDIDTDGNSDTLTLGADSNATITPDITFWNVGSSGFSNLRVQVLKGGSGAKLVLPGSSVANIKNRNEDFVTSGTVIAENSYGITDTIGTGTLNWSLAQTTSANDTLLMNLSNVQMGDSTFTRKDLFRDWLEYTGATTKVFKFTNAKTTYNTLEGEYGYTIPNGSVYSIIKDSAEEGTPVLNLGNRYVSLAVAGGARLNLSNVELANVTNNGISGRTFFANYGTARFENATFRNIQVSQPIYNAGKIEYWSGLVSSIGSCSTPIYNPGIIEEITDAIFERGSGWSVSMLNNGGTIGTADGTKGINNTIFRSSWGTRQILHNGNIIHNIINTTFTGNSNTYSADAPSTTAGIFYNASTINNMQGVVFDGNAVTRISTGRYAYGGALVNYGTITNGLVSSSTQNTVFRNNRIDAFGGRGAGLYNNGTIKVIDGVEFNKNYIFYRPSEGQSALGGGIFNTADGAITEGIKNSRFEGNYIVNTNQSMGPNASFHMAGGAIYNEGGALTITNTDFINNYIDATSAGGSAYGGALCGAYNITGGRFEGNHAHGGTGWIRGGAIYMTGGNIYGVTFKNNNSSYYGGAIADFGSIPHIDGTFEGNSAGSGGAIGGEGRIGEISGTFTNNSAGNGGAILNGWYGSLGKIYDATFTGNHAGSTGGAISNSVTEQATDRGINQILNSTFTGNYAGSHGGAIASSPTFVNEINGSLFNGNYVNSTGTGYGGAISVYGTGYIKSGIYNTRFLNNYVTAKNEAYGGAIYSERSLNIVARDSGLTEFTGNYVEVGGNKTYQAIYLAAGSQPYSLTLNSTTGGTLRFNDAINGSYGFTTNITGDNTGKLELFNNIANSKITANNTYIDTRNNSAFNYNFLSLNTANTVKYGLDLNLADETSDNFTLGYGSTGTMVIDDLNLMGSTSVNRKFQIIKNNRSDVKLELSKTKYGSYNVVENFLEDAVPDTVYHDGVYKQQKGLILSSIDTYHDSIEIIANETQYDPLNIILGKETENERNFVFRDNGTPITYTLTKDMNDVTAGTININGIAGKNPTINANGHNLFNLAKETTLTVSNVDLTGADDLITVSNQYSTVNLNNTTLTGNIKGNANFKLNLGGESTRIDGSVINATTTFTNGTIVINRDTFADSGNKVIATGGTLNLENDVTENFVINNLTSNVGARYNIDIDFNDLSSDTITINDPSATGVVTIGDINDFGRLSHVELGDKLTVKVLNTTSNAITLALADEVSSKVLHLGDLRREETDTVAMVTNFDTVYYNRYRLGIIAGTMSIEENSKDSITIEAVDRWNNTTTPISILGDTLQLVANADMPIRILQATSVTDTYNVGEDIGLVAPGELVISGINENDEYSILNMASHRGFVLGKDTSLSMNNVEVSGKGNPIEVLDSSVKVELNNAKLTGGIQSDVNYELSLIGNGITSVEGRLDNANATLTQGGFSFNHDTFAAENTTLNVQGGVVYMNDDVLQDYEFNNLISNPAATYQINADMVGHKADTFNIRTGSGAITLDGLEVIGATPILNQPYTIKVLSDNGNPINLEISDTLRSKMEGTYKMGTTGSTVFDTINPITHWTQKYYKLVKDMCDVYGHFTLNDAKDSIIVTATRIDLLGDVQMPAGDSLRLWNQLETPVERHFNFDSASDVYMVTQKLGETSNGVLNVNGVASGNDKSVIYANAKALFELANESTMNIKNIHFKVGRNSSGGILNITNSNSKVNVNNIEIDSIGTPCGINNAGTLTFTGSTNNLQTGISGIAGTLNINGGAVVNFGQNSNITQRVVNVNDGRLILDISDIIYGSVNIKETGYSKMSASAVTKALTNDGDLTVMSGTLAYAINGRGSTELTGDVTAYAGINQELEITSNSVLTTSADNIGGLVDNKNQLILTGGTLVNKVAGSGKTIVSGNVTADALISQSIEIDSEGTLVTDGGNIGAAVHNEKALTLIGGTLTQNVNGSGRTNIEGEVTLSSTITNNAIHLNSGVLRLTETSNIVNAAQLNVHDGTVSVQDEGIHNTNLGDVILNNNLNLALDVDLSTKTSDFINANSLTNPDNYSIIISSIKVLADAVDDLPFEVLAAGDVLRDTIRLSSDTITVQGVHPEASYLVTYSKDNGTLTFGYGNLSTAIALTASERQYNLRGDEDSNLGVQNGEGSTLNVFGHNYTVNVNPDKQWIIGSGKTVNLNDLTMQNANRTAIVNSGILNIKNVTFKNNTKDITNNNSLTFSGTNSVNTIDGNGTTTINGTFTNRGSITQNQVINYGNITNIGTLDGNLTNDGTITSSASNIYAVVSNTGTMNLTGGITKNHISGTGTINVQGDLNVATKIDGNTLVLQGGTTTIITTGTLNLNGLTANGGAINAQNSKMDNLNLGNVVLNNDLNISIDADLDVQTADKINGTSITANGHHIIIDSINILADATEDMPIEINVADSVLKSTVQLSGNPIYVAGVKENINYLVTYSTGTGNLTFYYGDLNSAVHLTASQRNYTMASDEIVIRDLGAMEDLQDVLNIHGNNYNIIGNNFEGITVGDGNTLRVNNVNEFKNFKTAINNSADGVVNIKNTNFKNNEKDIVNAGTLTFAGTNSFNTLEGTGSTTVNNGETTVNDSLDQNSVKITLSGSLINKGTVTAKTFENDGNVTNDGSANIAELTNNANGTFTNNNTLTAKLNNSGTLTNTQNLILTGGINSGTVNGNGTTSVTADFENRSEFEQHEITVIQNKTLTNNGTLAGIVTNNGTIANNQSLLLKGGTNSGTINGIGTTTVVENFANNSNLTQNGLVVNANKTLTNTGTVTVNTTLTNDGNIANNSVLNVNGTNNLGTITGTGTLNIAGTQTVNKAINQTDVNITTNSTLINNSTITSNVQNDGTFNNNSDLYGVLTNNGTGVATSNASNLHHLVQNNGTLNLTGGVTQNRITGTGTINVQGDLNVATEIEGNNLALGTGTTTSITSGILNLGGLTGNGGALNSINNKTDNLNLGNITLNNDINVAIDANLAEKWLDTYNANNVTANGDYNVVINSINILTDSIDRIPLTLDFANEGLRNNVILGSNFTVTSSDQVKDSYFISYKKSDGTLTFEYLTLPIAVASDTEQKAYIMRQDEDVRVDLGKLHGISLTVNANNHDIIGTGELEGIIVDGENQTLSLNDVHNYTGFDTAITNNAGTVNITDSHFGSNKTDISNNSTLNFYGNSSVNNVNGENGVTNIDSYTKQDGEIVNSVLTVNDNGNFSQKQVNITENNKLLNFGTTNIAELNNKGTIENNNNLNITTGVNSSSITGYGHTKISESLSNNGMISQKDLTVEKDATLTTDIDRVSTQTNILTNNGILFAQNGTNTLNIEGEGRTEIQGTITNRGTIKQGSVEVSESGKLTTNLDNLLTEKIFNSGEINIEGHHIGKPIDGTETGVVNINDDVTVSSTVSGTGIALNNNGILYFNNSADIANNSNFISNGGYINMVNLSTESVNLGKHLTMNKDLNLLVDVDLANVSMDRVTADSMSGDGYIAIKSMNMLSDAKENKTHVDFADDILKNNVRTDVPVVSYSPIWMYGVAYDRETGQFIFTKGGNGNKGDYSAFNPSVLTSPVATQVSGQMNMTQAFGEAFQHSDWFFKFSKADRFSKLHSGQSAISTDYNGNLGTLATGYENRGIWYRPYSNFESINLKNGPKVNMISYGTMVGGDSDFRILKRGWANVGTAYIGYQGSQFNYGGPSIYSPGVSATSNGGVLGVTETFYKGNFYTALTATAGGNFVETHGMFGKEDLSMLMGGIASKSGYNIELNNGKFIIQPNLLMSYSFVTTFNSTNSVGVKIENKPMHTIQLNPSLRFIGNTKNGWQPYATVGMVWNMVNTTEATANNIELPGMSTKPYIEYGLGIQKLWNDRFSAYGQATVRNGGRNGVALTAGLRWALGKESPKPQSVSAPTPNIKPVNHINTLAPVPTKSIQTPAVKSTVNKQTSKTVENIKPATNLKQQKPVVKNSANQTIKKTQPSNVTKRQVSTKKSSQANTPTYIKYGNKTIIKQLNSPMTHNINNQTTSRTNNSGYLKQL